MDDGVTRTGGGGGSGDNGDGDTNVVDGDADDGGADVDNNSACVHRAIESFQGSQSKHQPHSECPHEASHLTEHPITRHLLQTGKP